MILLLRYLAWFLHPLSVCLELLLLSLLLLWLGRRPIIARLLLTAAFALLLLFSWGPFSRLFVGAQEATSPPLLDARSLEGGADGPVRWVVVLGAGYHPDPDIPPTARLTPTSLVRLVEGIRIHSKLPSSKLIVLVGEEDEGDLRRRTVTELATSLGVPASDLVVEAGARDTAEEAGAVAKRVQKDRLVLVTSAAHLPRAVQLFRDRGLQPIPAPTDYVAPKREYSTLHDLPSPANLAVSEAGVHEWLASAWRALGGG